MEKELVGKGVDMPGDERVATSPLNHFAIQGVCICE